MLLSILSIVGGLVLLVVGADGLVRGSSSVALRMGVSALAVGLTIVAFGTSSPELVVSLNAALDGHAAISLGNVVGSNICNILLILGVSALIRPIKARAVVIKREMPILLVVSAFLWILIYDGELSRIDGVIFTVGILVYTFLTYYLSRNKEKKDIEEEFEEAVTPASKSVWLDIIFIVGGFVLLILGADVFLNGAVSIAKSLGISEVVIGLTIVSLGTSMPELATSAVASFKNESDVALGNIIGSNVFNILAVLGVTALVVPLSGQEITTMDLSVMLGSAFLLWLMLGRKFALDRLEGAILLIAYAIYIYMLIPK